MQEQPEKPIFGPELSTLIVPRPVRIRVWRSIAKAVSWRALGTIDTLVLSYLLISYLGPLFGMRTSASQAATTAGYIAITEVATKMTLYFVHEHLWSKTYWGVLRKLGRRKETFRRTSSKTATWRLIASLDTVALAWLYTGNVKTAVSISAAETLTKVTLYFLHERSWERVPYGIVGPLSSEEEVTLSPPAASACDPR